MILSVIGDIIPIDLMVDVVITITPQVVVMVILQMTLMEVAQIAPFPLNLEGNVDMINVLNNMSNLNNV